MSVTGAAPGTIHVRIGQIIAIILHYSIDFDKDSDMDRKKMSC
jgi:hypothetical protein